MFWAEVGCIVCGDIAHEPSPNGRVMIAKVLARS
jgi:hypothetical protein